LNACGDKLESPETVMKKAKEAITDVESGRIQVSADAEGQNGEDDLLFEGGMTLAFDAQDEGNKKIALHVMLSGNMRAGEKALSGEFDLDFVTVTREYYLKLNKLSSSDESLASVQSLIDMYQGKWLKIADDFIPEDIRELQEEDEATKLKKEALQELFRETTLFDVVKEYGLEKYNGEKVYHYGIRPSMEGFKDYMVKAAVIDGRELTAQEVEEAVQVLSYIKNAELYIDADDYYVLKSVLVFAGEALSGETEGNLDVEIVIEGSDYNKAVPVEVPQDAEDFNPLMLMMGLGAAPAVSEEAMAEAGTSEEVDTSGEDVAEE
jgi:hypothetical protein